MKMRILVPIVAMSLIVVGCEKKNDVEITDSPSAVESQSAAGDSEAADTNVVDESTDVAAEQESTAGDSGESDAKVLTDEQARDAVWKYICTEENPSLEEYDGEASVYCVVSSEEGADEIRIDFRSYTGSHEYFYIDRATGDTHSTQFVPGIIDEEEDTGLSINVWDYIDK